MAATPTRRVSSGERINTSTSIGHLQQTLRQRRIRLTRQRRVILQVMDSAEQHLDVDQILERAQNIDPEGYTLYTYAAIQVWTQAAAKAKTFDAAKVAVAMHGGSFETVLGPIAYTQKGDITKIDYVVYRWHNGNYSEL